MLLAFSKKILYYIKVKGFFTKRGTAIIVKYFEGEM